MAAYYPLINMNNFYRTGNQSGTSTGVLPNVCNAFDTFFEVQAASTWASQFCSAPLSRCQEMTLCNPLTGRDCSATRETLDATNYNYKTTTDSVIVGVKQAYLLYLGLRGPCESTEKIP